MNIPLTQDESAFAADNHELVYTYLRMKRYSVSEFYDIAIFGYLSAVRTYLSREDIRDAHEFRAIAFQCMRSYISNHFRKEKRRKNIAEILPIYDSDVVSDDIGVWESVSKKSAAESVRKKLPEVLTPRQSNIVYLKADGYSNREIGRQCGLAETSVSREIKVAGSAIRNNAPELIALIAA